MAYATADDLAAALRVQVTPKNAQLLDDCVAAAARQIDHEVGRAADNPITVPADVAIAKRVNVDYGVELFKAADAAFGGIGYDGAGVLRVKTDGFERHAVTLSPLKETFGVA